MDVVAGDVVAGEGKIVNYLIILLFVYNNNNNKMSFENQIQKWVSLDNQLKAANEKSKELREQRASLSDSITKYASANNLSNATVKISDGRLKFITTKVAEPLTFRYLEKSLGEIIKSEAQVKLIMEHIKQHRTVKNVQEIKRFSNE